MQKSSYTISAGGYGKSELKAAENMHNDDAKKLADLIRLLDRQIARQGKEKSKLRIDMLAADQTALALRGKLHGLRNAFEERECTLMQLERSIAVEKQDLQNRKDDEYMAQCFDQFVLFEMKHKTSRLKRMNRALQQIEIQCTSKDARIREISTEVNLKIKDLERHVERSTLLSKTHGTPEYGSRK